jgi:hypothetical protein
MHHVSSYNDAWFACPARRREYLDRAVILLSPIAHTFSTIAFRGTSGAMFGPMLADRLGKHITLVRKNDGHHACEDVSGALNCDYLIADDLISSGLTVRTIQEKIFHSGPEGKCAGIYIYPHEELILPGNNRDAKRYILHNLQSRYEVREIRLPVRPDPASFIVDDPGLTTLGECAALYQKACKGEWSKDC